jgi:hypothetical protein
MSTRRVRPAHKPWAELSDKEQLLFMASALVDFIIAADSSIEGCRIADAETFLEKPLYIALASMAITSYCRPFLGSDLSGKLESTRFPSDISSVLDEFRSLHDRVLNVRSNSIAHGYLDVRQPKIWREGMAYISEVSHEILEPSELDELGTLALKLKGDLDLKFQQMAARVHPNLSEADGIVSI